MKILVSILLFTLFQFQALAEEISSLYINAKTTSKTIKGELIEVYQD